MKKLVLMITALMTFMVVRAANKITVTVTYDKKTETATVSIPEEASSYVICKSGSDSHVKIEQLLTKENNTDEIEVTYALSGESNDGGFYMKGEYKCTISLNDVTLNNPSGPAIDIDNGKRIELNAGKEGVVNKLSDGTDGNWKACIYAKGHFELKGKGTLNVIGNTAHAISCKEYMRVKNLTLNITGAKKDGLHCQQYFWMEKGTVNISGAQANGIKVELDGKTSTGVYPDHENGDEDEDTGNCYLDDGTLTISDCGGSVIWTDGEVVISGGTQNYDASKVSENNATAITTLQNDINSIETFYDLNGRQLTGPRKGIVIIKKGNEIRKAIIK